MNDFYIGIITTVAVVVMIELLRNFDRRLIGSLTLTGIAFIYIGFSWADVPSLVSAILAVAVFFWLSYFGYKRNFVLVIAGLVLHGIWDIVFPLFSTTAPEGYGIFCLTVDLLLALYFFIRVKPLRTGIGTV